MAAGADSVETAMRSGMAQTLWSGAASLAGEGRGHRARRRADRGLPELVGQGRADARADPGDDGRPHRRPEHGVPPGCARRRRAARRRLPAPLPPERVDRRRRLLARGPLRGRERARQRARPRAREHRVRACEAAWLPPHGARRERAERRGDRLLREPRLHHRAQAARPHAVRLPQALRTLYPPKRTVLGGEVAVPCHPQAALAGLNSHPRGFAFGASTPDRGVDGRVPRGERSRTRSDPGGSSLKRYRSCAAGKPGRSRRSAGTPEIESQRRVHGPLSFLMGTDVVLEMAERWNSGDIAGCLDLYHDDVVMTPSPHWPETVQLKGKDAFRKNTEEWLGAWGSVQIEAEDVEAYGDRVAAHGSWVSTGRVSGLEGAMPIYMV